MGNKPTMSQIEHLFRLIEEGLATKENFQKFLEGCSRPVEEKEAVVSSHPSEIHARTLIPEGWVVVEDVPPSTTFEVKNLELVPFLGKGEQYVEGGVMKKRATEAQANLGLVDGKKLLDNQAKIPAEMRDYYLVLPGTVLRDPDGDLRVPYLYWYDGRWQLDFGWLDFNWRDRGRLLRSK